MSASSSNEPLHKRVALTSMPLSSATSMAAPSRTATGGGSGGGVSSNSASNNNGGNNNGATVGGSGGNATARKTYRFDLKLFEPTADSFPEFNYAKLVEMEEKKQKKLAKVNGALDDHNDDDVARIARELERKYGNAYAGKNCGKNSAGGACYDKGTGYDESDSFIDNTDAYDESVPVEIETDRGGFYINSGSLVFKPLANFERPDDALRIPKARKRTLSTSSESDGDSNGPGGPGGDKAGEASGSASTKNGPSDKKAKLLGDKERAAAKAAKLLPPAVPNNGNGKEATAGGDKIVKTTTVKDMLRAKRDSMRNLIDGGVVASSGDDEAAESVGGSDDSSDEEDDDDEEEEDEDESGEDDEDGDDDDEAGDVDDVNGAGSEHTEANGLNRASSAGGKDADGTARTNGADVRLPSDLPADLLVNILRLCDAATKCTGATASAGSGGPTKFSNLFDAANTDLLYRIDTAARTVGGTARNTIYNYLEHYLPCTKQTLQMRAKKCRLQREEAKTHKIVRLLRAAVEATMPQVMAAYEVECKRISDLRAEAVRADNREQLAALKAPKRRFVWTETTRALNAELFAQRRQSYFVIKPRKETVDEFVHKYVREHVVRVWPDGFMRLEELVREYEKRQSTTVASKKPKEKKIDGAAPKSESAVDGSGSGVPVIKSVKPDVLKQPSVIKVSIEPTSLTAHAASMPPAASPLPIAAQSTPFGDSSAIRLCQPLPQPASITLSMTTTSTIITTTTNVPPTATTPTTTTTTTTTKRSTDHSINSIISSSPVPQTHSATPSPPPQQPSPSLPATTISIGAPTPTSPPPPNNAVTITVANDLAPASDTGNAPPVDYGLRIRQVESLHADTAAQPISAPAITVQMTAGGTPPPLPSAAIEELLSSDSDDVEFVGECDLVETLPKRARTVAAQPAPKTIQINRQKYAKRAPDEGGSRSNSPMVNAAADADGGGNGDQARRDAAEGKTDDLDVDKIMSALKELQKPQPLPLPAAHRPTIAATSSVPHPSHHHHQQHSHNHHQHQQQHQQQQQRRTSSDQQQQQQQQQAQQLLAATLDSF